MDLIAGGVLSRVILGGDDFFQNPTAYHASSGTAPDIASGYPYMPILPGCQFVHSGYPTNTKTFLDDHYDFQPDQYSFNVPGLSGKFILKKNKEVILQDHQKIKISPTDNIASGWDITASDGTLYSFREFETYTDNENSSAGAPGTYKTAWFLTKILSPKGNSIDFFYTTVANVYIRPIGSITETQNPNIFFSDPVECDAQSAPNYLQGTNIESTPGKEYKKIYLSKIVFNDGEVRFNYASDRTDVVNDVRLSKIQLYRNTYNPSISTLFKEWELIHDYFVGSGDQDVALGTVDQRTKRLKLISVTEKDASGASITPHIFTYYNEDILNASIYPAKTSFARDHWGYYNGKTDNTSLIPNFATLTSSTNIVEYYLGVMEGNRDPDPAKATLFALKSIKYPTGGRTEFEYESNDFDFENSKVNDRSYLGLQSDAKQIRLTRMYPGNVYGTQPTAGELAAKTLDLSNLFTTSTSTTSEITVSAFFRYNVPNSICRPSNFANNVTYSFTAENGTVIEGPIDPIFSVAQDIVCYGSPTYVGFQITRKYTVPPGKYVWKLTINNGVTWLADVAVNVDYLAKAEGVDLLVGSQIIKKAGIGGGLRIKRILNYDSIASLTPQIRRFQYDFIDASGDRRSTGIRMAKPTYSYFDKGEDGNYCSSINALDLREFTRLFRASDSYIQTNGSGNENSIAYSMVTEFIGEAGEYGKTEYYYDNRPDIIPRYTKLGQVDNFLTEYPVRAPAFSSIPYMGNGNLIKKIVYKNRNGIFEKQSESILEYTNYFNNYSLWYGIERRDIATYNGGSNMCKYDAIMYPSLPVKRLLLTKETLIDYDLNDQSRSTVTKTSYQYDQNTHLQLKEKKEQLANNLERITSFTYPADYTDVNAGTIVTEMKNSRYMHSSVITQKTTLNQNALSQVIGGVINRYKIANGKVVSEEVAALELVQPAASGTIPDYLPSQGASYPIGYVGKIEFQLYDTKLNVTQARKKDNISMSYVWDYNSSFPIAQVSNANVSEIAYTSFEADGNGGWNIPSSARASNSITGTRCYDVVNGAISKSGLVAGKAYVVSFWTTNASPFTITGGTASNTRTGRTYNGWRFYEIEVTASGATLSIAGTGLIDELRCYPKGSLMHTYTYTPLVGVTSECDATNKINYYEYDGFGRLRLIKDLDGNILQTFEYRYKL